MSFLKELGNISAAALTYTPVAISAVTEIETAAAGLPGQTKAEIAAGVVMAAAKSAASIPVPEVQGIAALINLIVGIMNATGVFKHATAQ